MSYVANGWTISKEKVAYYTFGDKTKTTLVDDIVCADAITMLETQLNNFKAGLSNSVDKNDATLNLALVYLAACFIVKSGQATQHSGVVQSESMEGMSISYGGEQQQIGVKASIPRDFCNMAMDLINRFMAANKLLTGKIRMSVSNYRDKLFNGTYDKYRQTTEWL